MAKQTQETQQYAAKHGMSESEAEFVLAEDRKLTKQRVKELAYVRKTGEARTQQWLELLLVNDLIEFVSPDETNPYNHYRVNESRVNELGW